MNSQPTTAHFPRSLTALIVAVCVAPFLLNLLGFDFGTERQAFDLRAVAGMAPHEITDAMFYSLAGAFEHTLLEWSAFCAAIFTAFLAATHFRIAKDPTTPIIGAALFFSGCMDAFHTLAADRLIEAVADNRELIPFTWAICRIFNAIIMITGLGMFLFKDIKNLKADVRLVALVSLMFGLTAYGIIQVAATSTSLPQTMYPDSLITRPFDVVPLVLFIFAGLVIYPRFYKRHPSFFSFGLIISVIPEIATELHMAFGSTALFDNHFNIAHFLKIVAYVVPFAGLSLDYIFTYRREVQFREELEVTNKELDAFAEQLEDRVRERTAELDAFAHSVSHDLRAPRFAASTGSARP